MEVERAPVFVPEKVKNSSVSSGKNEPDHVSAKIEFMFLLNENKNLTEEVIKEKSLGLLAWVEGSLMIRVDDEACTTIEHICLLDLAVQLHHWLAQSKHASFRYVPIDPKKKPKHPILAFRHIRSWLFRLYAQGTRAEKRALLPKDALKKGIHRYLSDLDKELFTRYGFHIDEITKKYFLYEIADTGRESEGKIKDFLDWSLVIVLLLLSIMMIYFAVFESIPVFPTVVPILLYPLLFAYRAKGAMRVVLFISLGLLVVAILFQAAVFVASRL